MKAFSFTWLFVLLAFACLALGDGPRGLKLARQDSSLQNIVTWDQYSLKINGERLFIFSGEVHPYRQAVQDLHLDVMQKIKSMGFNAVSFYVFWGLHEPKAGDISFEGFRDLQPFIDAAKAAGLYLIARPGPYINAEVSGGGFPGWGLRNDALWRTSNTSYVEAYQLYMKSVNHILAKNQITQGGPIILYQSENEYTNVQPPYTEDKVYEDSLIDLIVRDTGIVVPITTNDASPKGMYTQVDLYGHDSYPNGFDCSQPKSWESNGVPTTYWASHLRDAPNIPYAIYEFQGGAFDGWGGAGYEKCAERLGTEFERVFYKNQYAISTSIFSLYMIFGGTNFGGIAHPGVYTSYDYGSAIAEDRTLREKYSELKLQANFLRASPAYLTTRPINFNSTQGAFTGNSALRTTQTLDVIGNKTTFYTVRQTDAASFNVQTYKLTIPTSVGQLTIPVLGGSLALTGRDSKIHVVDYQAGNTTLLYSTAEVFTWATIDGRDIIIVYGDAGELHETAFTSGGAQIEASVISGGTIQTGEAASGSLAIQYKTTGQTVVQIGSTTLLYIVERAIAYEFWVLHPSTAALGAYNTKDPVIIKGGYYLRSISVDKSGLTIKGDLNGTATFEIIAPKSALQSVKFNQHKLQVTATSYGTVTASLEANLPDVSLPDLAGGAWKTADSLPELSSNYDDGKWTKADLTTTVNPRKLTTPVNLYASDYGYHTGSIIWRGHFTATGTETGINLEVAGGQAFGFSAWLGSDFLGSWYGNAVDSSKALNLAFKSTLSANSAQVLTVVHDHMGLDEDWWAASETFKAPRGILNYNFTGSASTTVSWKVTGNLGGESYVDKDRGPLNEGSFYGERQGWHLPGFDDSKWEAGSPLSGISKAGISFYRTTFNLNIPDGIDYPIALTTTNATTNSHFRSKFFINGWQFGRYANSIGPQASFLLPQGVLNYKGTNTLAVSLWATEAGGAKLESLALEFTAKAESSINKIKNVAFTPWKKRLGAY
ncbi:glycoside hydrolase family 35 protein [Flagelloscypha sp. PMI_526]|nr:glycoside hydrolase family 35 protein [Flagelloscypha sp. PMI_526]